jgi:hypothetical protein
VWCTCPPTNATHLALDRFNGYTVQFYPSTTASPNLVTILESIPTLRQLAFQQRSAAENNGILTPLDFMVFSNIAFYVEALKLRSHSGAVKIVNCVKRGVGGYCGWWRGHESVRSGSACYQIPDSSPRSEAWEQI